MSAMFLPVSFRYFLAVFYRFELCGKGQQRSELCRVKSSSFKMFLYRSDILSSHGERHLLN